MEFTGLILVEDVTGARMRVGAFQVRRFFKSKRKYRLRDGAEVERLDFDNFVVPKTGMRLKRVDPVIPADPD